MSTNLSRVPPGSAPSSTAEIDTFLAKTKAMPRAGTGRLIFGLDATMSRQPTWDRAQSIQGQMFVEAAKSGQLSVQLAYFRGFNESKTSKWVTEGAALARLMSRIDCRGGNTQIGKLLSHIKLEAQKHRVSAAVFIGDAMEEGADQLCVTAGEIGLIGTPIFMFQEGDDKKTEATFREIARLTGGAYFRLNENSASELSQILAAVAAFAAGGYAALESSAKQNGMAARLLPHLKK